MTLQSPPKESFIVATQRLRACAVLLCANVGIADDLVQETLELAWANAGRFEGMSLSAGLIAILRNRLRARHTKGGTRFGRAQDADPKLAQIVEEKHGDLLSALARLSCGEREVLALIDAAGLSYTEAAEICRSSVATIEARAGRGRARLARLLSIDREQIFGCLNWPRGNEAESLMQQLGVKRRNSQQAPAD